MEVTMNKLSINRRSIDLKIGILKTLPYIIILLASLISSCILFYQGFPIGDDTAFHISHIWFLFEELKNNTSTLVSNLNYGIGYGKGLFYSPFSHLIVAIFGVVLSPFGISLLTCYKIVIFLSIFISGIFMYRFVMHFTKDKIWISILISVFYVFCPYRLFDLYCRSAFAEGISFLFIPLFFMGIYDICNIRDNDFTNIPFIEVIIGGVGLYLTHNITALFSYLNGVIMILFYIVPLFKEFKKDKRLLPYIIVSLSIMLMLVLFILVRSFTMLNSGIYNVSDNFRMWTNVEHVSSDTSRTYLYSGYLNYSWLDASTDGVITLKSTLLKCLDFIFITLTYFILGYVLKKTFNKFNCYSILKYLIPLLLSGIYILVGWLVKSRIEFFYAILATAMLYLVVEYLIILNDNFNNNKNKIYKNILFWASLCLMVFNFILAFSPSSWYLLPSIFYVIQFPWRVNAFAQFFLYILIGILLDYYGSYLKYVFVLAIGLTPFLTMATVEKRILKEKIGDVEPNGSDTNWITEIDGNTHSYYYRQLGANREYLPQIYYYYTYNDGKKVYSDGKAFHESIYENSLYYDVHKILSGYSFELNPIFLKGSGTINVTNNETPILNMDVEVNETSLIQTYLIYYKGYKITILNKDTNETKTIDPYNPEEVDYLVSFELEKGNYQVSIDYVGTSSMTLSYDLFFVGIYSLMLFSTFDILYLQKKKKEESLF